VWNHPFTQEKCKLENGGWVVFALIYLAKPRANNRENDRKNSI
jgi:hypothetical protein